MDGKGSRVNIHDLLCRVGLHKMKKHNLFCEELIPMFPKGIQFEVCIVCNKVKSDMGIDICYGDFDHEHKARYKDREFNIYNA